jgi:indolepyruvate ferredoxin oxidoreductase beta subunit
VVVLNTATVLPYTVYLGKSRYPGLEEIVTKLHQVTDRVITLDAGGIARQAGSIQAANIVMLGALFGTGLLPVKPETARAEVQSRFPAKAGATNLKAFDLGYEEVRKALKGASN